MGDYIVLRSDSLSAAASEMSRLQDALDDVVAGLARVDTSAEWWTKVQVQNFGGMVNARDALGRVKSMAGSARETVSGTSGGMRRAQQLFEAAERQVASDTEALMSARGYSLKAAAGAVSGAVVVASADPHVPDGASREEEEKRRARETGANIAKWVTTGLCVAAGIAVTVATGGAALPVIITGALTGGAIAAVNTAADQYVEADWEGIDWGDVAWDGCIGMATGAVTSAIGMGVSKAATSGLISAIPGGLARNIAQNAALNIGVHAVAGGTGQVAGGIASRASGKIVQSALETGQVDWKEVSEEAFSAQRIVVDAGMGMISGGLSARQKLLSQEQQVADPSFLDEDGRIRYAELAPKEGFVDGTKETVTLQPGTRFDRYGDSFGRYSSPAGTPFEQRALPYIENPNALHCYEVIKPIEGVDMGEIAPAFNQPGGGTQYKLPSMIHDLVRRGYLREV